MSCIYRTLAVEWNVFFCAVAAKMQMSEVLNGKKYMVGFSFISYLSQSKAANSERIQTNNNLQFKEMRARTHCLMLLLFFCVLFSFFFIVFLNVVTRSGVELDFMYMM